MNELRSRNGSAALVAVVLAAATALLFHRVTQFGFVNYDDPALLLRNPNVNTGLSLRNLQWALTSTEKLQWAPLTWLTHMVDFQIFGAQAGGHHLTSLLFHLFNTVALLALLFRATGALWQSAFVAALFAAHPLHVEPVAWLSARKDLVSTAFLLLALHAYLAYARSGRVSVYFAALAAYTASLMAKPMYVTLPAVLLLLDLWPMGRLRSGPEQTGWTRRPVRLLVEKLPFVAVAAASAGVAYFTQAKADAVVSFRIGELASRAAGVVVGYAMYVAKTLWPAKLAVVYPRSPLPAVAVIAALVLLVGVTVGVVRGARARPYLLVGWLWFLVTLLPVIGIVQIGSAWMADKFTYLPIVGLFVMVAWGVSDVASRTSRRVRASLAVAAGVVLLACGIRSYAYVGAWKDSVSLYTEALEVTDKNFVVLGNLAYAYQEQGRLDEALAYYHESIRAEPRYEIGWASIGLIWLYARGDCARATPYLDAAMRLNPNYQPARQALAYCRR
jgi:hypothetical protein